MDICCFCLLCYDFPVLAPESHSPSEHHLLPSSPLCSLSRTVQFSSVAQSCLTLCDPMNRSTPGPLPINNSRSLPKLMSMESVMPSNHLILCHPLLLPPSIFPSIRIFSNESALPIRWPKYLSFSFNISPSSEHPGLISFRMDWLDLFAVQGLPGSSPGGSREFEAGRASARIRKQLLN